MANMPIGGPGKALLVIVGMMLAIVGVVLVLMNRRQVVGRAELTFANLCSQLGLVPIQKSASAVKYFREFPFFGFGRELQLATGNVDGLHMELCFVPVMKSARRGQSMIGIRCRVKSGLEVGLTEHDVIRSAVGSLSGQSDSGKGPSRFGKYDTWGKVGDVARVFTTEVQALVGKFPELSTRRGFQVGTSYLCGRASRATSML